ncbi:MAG: hypothetical protein GY838_00315 [bacterium]|nr:hypothetical protein [bacterium]
MTLTQALTALRDAGTAHDLARDLDSYVIADALATLVMHGPHARRKFEVWKSRKAEFTAACGWNLLAGLALDEDRELEASWLRTQLKTITAEIHQRPNRVRHSMNQALICIGVRGGALEKAALAAAKKVGKVVVDHGQTSCKTPDAASYIAKTLAHRGRNKKKAGC